MRALSVLPTAVLVVVPLLNVPAAEAVATRKPVPVSTGAYQGAVAYQGDQLEKVSLTVTRSRKLKAWKVTLGVYCLSGGAQVRPLVFPTTKIPRSGKIDRRVRSGESTLFTMKATFRKGRASGYVTYNSGDCARQAKWTARLR